MASRLQALQNGLRFCVALFLALLFFLSQASHHLVLAAETGPQQGLQNDKTVSSPAYVKAEMLRFSEIGEAEEFLNKIAGNGYAGGIEQQRDSSGSTEYQVYAFLPTTVEGNKELEDAAWPVLADSTPPPAMKSTMTVAAPPEVKTEMGRFSDMETARAFLSRLSESGYTGSIEEKKNGSGKIEYLVFIMLPAGQDADSESPAWSVMGEKGKNIHAALTLTGVYTDNAYNTKKNRKSDFSLLLTPEIWLNAPRTDKAESYGTVSPRSAGGHLLDTLAGERLFGYQASLYYRTDLPLSTSNTSPYGDTATHKLAAGLNLIGNNLSLYLSDQFEKSYQEREGGQMIRPDDDNRYDANRFGAGLAYDTRNRLIFSLDYVNFITRNQDDTGEALDRKDWGLAPAIRYRLTPKINLLVEYSFYVVSYDSSGELDSREHYLQGGLEWRLTEKSFGRIKAGYEVKNFNRGDSYKGFSCELQMEQRLTAKTNLSLSAYRKTNETRVADTVFTITTGARLNLNYMLTSKIMASGMLSYENDRNKGTSPTSLSKTVLDEEIYQAGIELQYEFRRWLRARVGYLFAQKDASDSSYDYRSNTLFFSLTGSF